MTRRFDLIAQPAQSDDVQILRESGSVVQYRSRTVTILGERQRVDPHQLIRLIRRVTQTIGEYKGADDLYGRVIVGALRKARGDLVSILENEFGIHWRIDAGQSVFFA